MKVYQDNAVLVAALLGGPFAAGYLLAANFKTFSESSRARTTWVVTIIGFIVIMALALILAARTKFPGFIIPLAYSFAAFSVAKNLQGQRIKETIDSGGQYHGWGRVIGISLICLALTLIIVFASAAVLALTSFDLQD